MFVKNDDHLSPDSLYTTVNGNHPNINQRIYALDKIINNEHKTEVKNSY